MDHALLADLIRRYEAASLTVNRKMAAAFRVRMQDGLTVDQLYTLRYIRDRGRTTSSALADAFCVGKSSITAIVTRLADKGLIRREPDGADRRIVCLVPTPEGEALAAELEERIREMLGGYIQHFEEAEALAFIHTFEKLADVLQDPAPADEAPAQTDREET